MAKITRPEALSGKFVNLREVTVEDAAFILDLRTDPQKAKFIHATEGGLVAQEEYIRHYLAKEDEWYFIVESKVHEPLGTLRIYDVQPPRFTDGSWLMKDGAEPQESLEGHWLLMRYAFEVLGFDEDLFDVRKGNANVIRYHKMRGAAVTGETDLDILFRFTKADYLKGKGRMASLIGLGGGE